MTAPLPRRIAWFAPWTWKRRAIVAVVMWLGIVAYPLSIGPAHYMLKNGWLPWDVYRVVYAPLRRGTPECLRYALARYLRFF